MNRQPRLRARHVTQTLFLPQYVVPIGLHTYILHTSVKISYQYDYWKMAAETDALEPEL